MFAIFTSQIRDLGELGKFTRSLSAELCPKFQCNIVIEISLFSAIDSKTAPISPVKNITLGLIVLTFNQVLGT